MLPICTSYAVGWKIGLCLMDDFSVGSTLQDASQMMKIFINWDSLLKIENLPGGDWHPRCGGVDPNYWDVFTLPQLPNCLMRW